MNFSPKHEEQLREYFSGELAGKMGLRSAAGAQLEHMHRQQVNSTRDPSVSYMTVKKASQESSRSEWDVMPEMMEAAGETRRIRATLRRMEGRDVQVLGAAYAPRSPGGKTFGVEELEVVTGAPNLKERIERRAEVERILGTFAPLVALVLGEDTARSLARFAASDDASQRRAGKRGLESGRHQAGQALAAAHERYADAALAQADAERDERDNRLLCRVEAA